jgi:hypothetical protein
MGEPLEASKALIDLLTFALHHGVESVREGGPLVPFVVTETSGERELHRFVAERLEQGLDEATAFGNAQLAGMERCVLAYDRYLTTPGGGRRDAIYVEGIERRRPESIVLAQRYAPRRRLRRFSTIGDPALLASAHRRLRSG